MSPASNFYQPGNTIEVTESILAHLDPGDGFVDVKQPVLIGAAKKPGVAGDSAASAATIVPVHVEGVFLLDVEGKDGTGDLAVTEGDLVYYDAGVINVDSTNGDKFGMAMAGVASGATTNIPVKLLSV